MKDKSEPAFPSPSSAMTGEVRELLDVAVIMANELNNSAVSAALMELHKNLISYLSQLSQLKRRNEELEAWIEKAKTYFKPTEVEQYDGFISRYRQAVETLLVEAPEVSHANLKAQWQAEALREAALYFHALHASRNISREEVVRILNNLATISSPPPSPDHSGTV